MPEYVAKAWYKDLAMWVHILTMITGTLSDPSMAGLIPAPYLAKVITLIGLVNTIIRSVSTARPVGMSDGSRSVEVSMMEKKV